MAIEEAFVTTVTGRPTDVTLDTRAVRAQEHSRRRRRGGPDSLPLGAALIKWGFLGIGALIMLVPMYIMIISAFKSEADIFANPLGISAESFTPSYLVDALTTSKFNVVAAYGTTLMFVVLVNIFSIALAAPVSYVIARGRARWHVVLLLLFVSGLFIPGQATLIPAIFVLRTLGLMGTIPGFVLFETAHTLPLTIFLFVAYVRTIPREIDEAAAIDGAGKMRAFWSCIFPIMRPAVATVIVLTSIGVWNDFVTPQTILGPGSDLYTVTTGVNAAISQFSTDFTVVFPTLLLAIAPAIVFFIFMQRYIIGGLAAGATKG